MFIRWFNPVLFFGAALYVRHFNAGATDRQLVLPGMDLLVGPELRAQGAMTWKIVLGVAVLLVGWAIFDAARSRRPAQAESNEGP